MAEVSAAPIGDGARESQSWSDDIPQKIIQNLDGHNLQRVYVFRCSRVLDLLQRADYSTAPVTPYQALFVRFFSFWNSRPWLTSNVDGEET